MQFVVLPGLDGTGDMQRDFCAALQEYGDVLPVAYGAEVATYAQALDHVRRTLPEGPFVIVGESFSGSVAAMLAAERPAGLRGVVYLASFAHAPRRLPVWMARLVRFAPVQARWAIWMIRPFLIGRWAGPEFVDRMQATLANVPAPVLAARLAAVLRVDVRDALARVEVPQLYVQASADWLVPPRAARAFAQAGCEVVQVEGPHFLAEGNAVGVVGEVSHFATKCQQTPY